MSIHQGENMSDFYGEMQIVASGILQEFKQGLIEYVRITKGDGPEDNPGKSLETKYILDGAARGVKSKYVQQGLAVASDLQVVASVNVFDIENNSVKLVTNPVSVNDVKLEQSGFIDLDGERFKIVEILPRPAVGTTVANVMIIRK